MMNRELWIQPCRFEAVLNPSNLTSLEIQYLIMANMPKLAIKLDY